MLSVQPSPAAAPPRPSRAASASSGQELLLAARAALPPDVAVVAGAATLRRAVLDVIATPAQAEALATSLASAVGAPVELLLGPWREEDAGRIRLRVGAADAAGDPVAPLALVTGCGLTARGEAVAAALARLAGELLALPPVAAAQAAARALALTGVEAWLRGAADPALLEAARAAGVPAHADPDAPAGAWEALFTARDALGRTRALLAASREGVAGRGPLALGSAAERRAAVAAVAEHLEGALPAWLAPEPVVVLPVGPADLEAARSAARALGASEPEDAQAPLARRLAAAAALRPPYLAIVGPAERDAARVALRARGSTASTTVEVGALRARLTAEVASRACDPHRGPALAGSPSTRPPAGGSPTTNGG